MFSKPMEVLLIFLQILLFGNGAFGSDCPLHWASYNTSCYRVISHTRTFPAMTWEEARVNCLGFGGDLVSIDSASESTFIHNQLKNERRNAFWIGLYRNETSNPKQGWVWVDGTKLEYSRWKLGEPNNYNGNEKCGEIYSRDGLWNDGNCGNSKPSICERKKGLLDPIETLVQKIKSYNTTAICEIGWKAFRKSCYKRQRQPATWNRAKSLCASLGGHLLKIDDAVENKYFSLELKNSSRSYWIGLNDLAKKGVWAWEFGNSTAEFTKWNKWEPNNLGYERCVEMFGGFKSGFWNNLPCRVLKPSICEKEEGTDLCPAGWIPFEDDCYQFNTVSQRKSWAAAKRACESIGDFSSLAIIKTKAQQDFIEQTLSIRTDVWIGLSDTEKEHVFKWTDKTYLRDSDFANWVNENRQDGNTIWKDCVFLRGQSNYAWTVGNCRIRQSGFICQRKRAIFSCSTPLGMENGNIEDDQIKASSYLKMFTPQKARLRSNGSWCPLGDKNEYLEVDLGSVYKIKKIAVQGLATSYCIKYGTDGKGYRYYGSNGDRCEDFSSEATEEIHFLKNVHPFIARYVRIFPRGHKVWCLRVELFGCFSASTIDKGIRRPIWKNINAAGMSVSLKYQINYKPLSWTDARSYCLAQGADLLSISSYSVHVFMKLKIRRLRGYAFWIGLSDRDYASNYYWSDGSPMSFFGWAPGYPRDPSDTYSCIQVERLMSGWIDRDCTAKRPSICMKKATTRIKPDIIGSGTTGVWMSSTNYYWPLFTIENGKTWGSTIGKAYGTIKSTSGVKNRANAALKFVGSGSYIDAGSFYMNCLTAPDICSRSGLSISFMASFDSVAANWKETVNILDSLGSERNSTGVAVYVQNKKLWFVVSTATSYWTVDIDIQGDKVWRHYAMDWGLIHIAIYLNGRQVKSRAYRPNYTKTKPSKILRKNFYIGIQPNSKIKTGEVNLAMLAVWETLLSTKKKTGMSDFETIYKTEFGWCPNGWIEFGMSCYQFNEKKMSWQDARVKCQSSGGELVAISSAVEQGFITQHLGSSSWIGLNKAFLTEQFVWSNSENIVYTNWRAKRPFIYRVSRVCARVRAGGFGTWEEVPCTYRAAFVCERKKVEDRPAYNDSDVGTPEFKRICQFSKSRLICPHGTTIRIDSAFWGRKRRDVCRYISIVDCGLNGVSNTTKKLKNICEGKQHCNIFASSHDNYYGNPCSGVYKYLEVNYTCAREDSKINRSCPSGWTGSLDGNACYDIILSRKTWHDAEQACRKFDANLLSINGRFEQAMATSLMERALNTSVWIGLNDLQSQGIYNWSDGTSVRWTNWYFGQPDEKDIGKSCTYMNLYRSKKDWMFWRDGNCSREFSFMCKKQIGKRNMQSHPVKGGCPDGWDSYGINCYRLYTNTFTWESALSYCKRLRGSLASVSSPAENDFIMNLANQTVWIGLNSKGVFRGHAWSDNYPVAYTNWDVGQPDSYNGREDCVQLYVDTGYWSDISCTYSLPFICKRQKSLSFHSLISPSTSSPTFGFSNNCKKGWYLFNNMCYYFGSSTSTNFKTWHDAETTCRNMGGHLTSVNGQAEKDFLVAASRNMRIYAFWLGLNDIGPESNYKWTDGSAYGNFIYWNIGEPNNYYGQEDCVAMISRSGKWNDNHCSSKKSYICKAKREDAPKIAIIRPGINVSPDGYCASGWVVNGQWCYEFHTDPTDYKTWNDAKTTCEKGHNSSAFGELVSIANPMEQAFITLNMKGEDRPLWIGLNNFHKYSSFAWTDNSPANYYNWNKGQPTSLSRWKPTCVVVLPYLKYTGRWEIRHCEFASGYICKTASSPTPIKKQTVISARPTDLPSIKCPHGYSVYQQSCYKFVKTPKTFDDARKTCKLQNAELISISTTFEQAYLLYLLERNIGSVWIGLIREPWSSFSFSNNERLYGSFWAVGEPNRQLDQRSCVLANVSGQDPGRWHDVDCDKENPFVCQIYKGDNIRTTLTEKSHCEEGWEKYDKFCYKYFDMRKSWAGARHECQNNGGDLLSIADDKEQDFALYRFSGSSNLNIWIGLNDRNEEQGYQWSDKSPVTYINWQNGQPNDAHQTQNCVSMSNRNGKWSDFFCSFRHTFICKRSLECSLGFVLKSSMLSVSESSAPNLGSDQAIINEYRENNYTWCANVSSRKPWIQIDLGTTVKVTKITIQGRSQPYPQYVRSFIVRYSSDGSSWSTYSSLDGIRKIFFANNQDGSSLVTKNLDRPIKASTIAIIPLTWKGEQICMKVGLAGCNYVCQSKLGMKSGEITDDSLVAKSAKYPTNGPSQAGPLRKGWCAAVNDDKQWIQVDLKAINLVTKIMTFGDRKDSYVKTYKIQFSGDGSIWIDYMQHGTVRIFKGNLHASHPMTHTLSNSIQASYIRIVPLSWNNNICMRFELFGCKADCDGPLIEDSSDIALSSSDPNSHPEYALLNSGKAWCTKTKDGQYLEVDFGKRVRIRQITTVGSPLNYGDPRRVVTFTLKFLKNGRWKEYTVENVVKHIVSGNLSDSTTPSSYRFSGNDNGRLVTRIRIYPEIFTKSGICMRVEFYGCLPEKEIKPTQPSTAQKLLYINLRFTSLKWNNKLKQSSSKEFKATSNIISNAIQNVYESNNDIREGEALREVRVRTLSKGSVIADFVLVFNPEFAKNENISKPLLDAVNNGHIGNLSVDKNSLVINENSPPLAVKRESKKMSSGVIAGLVVGVLLALILVLGIGFYCVRKQRQKLYAPEQFNNPILYSSTNTEEFEDE